MTRPAMGKRVTTYWGEVAALRETGLAAEVVDDEVLDAAQLVPGLAGTVGQALLRAARVGQARLERVDRDLELQVLRGMSQGKSNGQIGRELYLSEDTIKTHARRLFRKLGAKDRAEAVATGFRRGMMH